ncbi:MAG: MFS transporter [Bacillota bacterium]
MKILYMNKNFSLLLSGKLISLLGSSIYYIGLVWYILSLPGTENGWMLTWVMVLSLLPTVLLGTFIGSMVDRYNKKKVIVFSDICSGMTVLLMTHLLYNGTLHPAMILISTSILSITTSALSIAVKSIIPEILSFEELQTANSSNLFVERITSLMGLMFGGMLVGLFGTKVVFLFNGLSFLISAGFEMFIDYDHEIPVQINTEQPSLLRDFQDIKDYLSLQHRIKTLLLTFTFVNFLWDPLFAVVVPFVLKAEFSITPVEFGLIEGSLGLGFCLASIYFSKKPAFLQNDRVLYISILVINTMICLFALPIVFQSTFIRIPYLFLYFMAALLIAGCFSSALNISVATFIQKTVPPHFRGKFHGVSTSIAMGLTPLSGIVYGSLIGKINSSLFFIISCGLIYMAVFFIPSIRYLIKHFYDHEEKQVHDPCLLEPIHE